MPVRWGFLGAGWIAGRALAPAVHAADDAVLQSVAARDVDRARALQPAGSAYDDYAALLDDPTVDAVYISLTNEAHASWSTAALEAGKHVLCEKPLAMNAAEVEAMAATAERTGRLLVEASWYRWHPRVAAARKALRDGRIGAVRAVSAGFTFAGNLDGNYRLDLARGGGALYDVGCYAVSAALWAFGALPVRVEARAELGPSGVDLVTEATLEFPSGKATVRAGISEPARQWLVVDGTEGRLELVPPAFTCWRQDAGELAVTTTTGTDRQVFPAVDAYQLMVEAMSARIAGRDAWLLPLSESRATAAVLDACFASARAGAEAVDVDAVS